MPPLPPAMATLLCRNRNRCSLTSSRLTLSPNTRYMKRAHRRHTVSFLPGHIYDLPFPARMACTVFAIAYLSPHLRLQASQSALITPDARDESNRRRALRGDDGIRVRLPGAGRDVCCLPLPAGGAACADVQPRARPRDLQPQVFHGEPRNRNRKADSMGRDKGGERDRLAIRVELKGQAWPQLRAVDACPGLWAEAACIRKLRDSKWHLSSTGEAIAATSSLLFLVPELFLRTCHHSLTASLTGG